MAFEHSASTFVEFVIDDLKMTNNGAPQALQSLEMSFLQNMATQLTAKFVHILDPYNGSSNLGSSSLMFATRMIQGLNMGLTQMFRFKYGYSYPNGSGGTGSIESPMFSLVVTDLKFTMDSRLNGISYTLTGMSPLVLDTVDVSEGYSWSTDPDGLVGGKLILDDENEKSIDIIFQRIKDVIVYVLQKKHGYTVKWIEEPNTLIDSEGNIMEVTDAFNLLSQTLTEEGISDITFIKSNLLIYLQKQTKVGNEVTYRCNYTINLNDDINNKTATIQPSGSYIKTDSTITEVPAGLDSFKDTGLHFYWQGGYLVDSQGLSNYGGNGILSCTLEFDPLAISAGLLGESVTTAGDTVSSGTGVGTGFYSTLDGASINLMANSYESFIGKYPIKGSITIPGYPNTLDLLSIITVHLFIGNTEFPTSGKYLILGKQDTIQNGVFTTTLDLIKAADLNGGIVGDYSSFNGLEGLGLGGSNPKGGGGVPPGGGRNLVAEIR